MGFRFAFASVAATALIGSASATTLTFTGVADDFFEAYISTNDSVEGTQFLAQTNTWQAGAVTGNVALTAGVTHYLHIRARDVFGAPSMLVGEASLSDAGFSFDNNTQGLLTNATDWKVSLTGFGSNYQTPAVVGQNGQNVWGTHAGISLNALRIWSTTSGGGGEHYFTARINAVPEPASMVALGLGALALVRRRRAK